MHFIMRLVHLRKKCNVVFASQVRTCRVCSVLVFGFECGILVRGFWERIASFVINFMLIVEDFLNRSQMKNVIDGCDYLSLTRDDF